MSLGFKEFDRSRTTEGDIERLSLNGKAKGEKPKAKRNMEHKHDVSKKEVIDLVQAQMSREFAVERLYLGVAAFFSLAGMNNSAQFFMYHAGEEKKHAMDFYKFLVSQGVTPKIPTENTLEMPKIDCVDCALDETLKHEQEVSKYIAEAYKAAAHATYGAAMGFLQKYLQEQVEEEEWAMDIMLKWQMSDGNKADFEAAMATDY